MAFQIEQLTAECLAALAQDKTHKSVREVVARAVSDPAAVLKGLGEPTSGGIQKLYVSKELTIINVVWAPHMAIMPHNHLMWGVIGLYSGREDNIFWRRVPGDKNGKLEAAGARELFVKDAEPLGRDIIHSVINPIPRYSASIHVYGGDFFDVESNKRSAWEPETLLEKRYDPAKVMRMFEDANKQH